MDTQQYSLSPAAARAREALFAQASADYAVTAARFFKTGRGDYGEGDRFIGVRVPDVRKTGQAILSGTDTLRGCCRCWPTLCMSAVCWR